MHGAIQAYLFETLSWLLARSLHRELGAEDITQLRTVSITATCWQHTWLNAPINLSPFIWISDRPILIFFYNRYFVCLCTQ